MGIWVVIQLTFSLILAPGDVRELHHVHDALPISCTWCNTCTKRSWIIFTITFNDAESNKGTICWELTYTLSEWRSFTCLAWEHRKNVSCITTQIPIISYCIPNFRSKLIKSIELADILEAKQVMINEWYEWGEMIFMM